MMTNAIVVFVSSVHVLAAHSRVHRIARCETFTPDDDGLAAFGAFLGNARGAPVYVVADTVEEDYRYETLPHATGADRASLLERKFRQYYRSTRFATALLRGRISDNRRDDRYLFAALTNPALIEPWLDVIAEQGAALAGVFLAPLLTAGVLARLGITTPRVLVAAPHRAGLRLTFYKDGEFCTSRLTRAIPQDAHAAGQMLAAELSNTRLYLSTLHLDAVDETLNVVFLDCEGRLAPIVAHIAGHHPGLACTCVDRATLIKRLGVSEAHLDRAPETLYLPALAAKLPEANLAPMTLTAGYRQLKRRMALYTASAALGLAGVAWAGYNLWQAHDFALDTERDARATAAAQAQYREITRTFPATPTASENLIKAVQVYQQVVQSVHSPQPLMLRVSHALKSSAEIYLQELGWKSGAEYVEPASGAPPQESASAPVAMRQTATLAGEVRPFYGDFRAAIASINAFAARLAREPGVADVKIVKLPLNVSPELPLTGDTREAADHSGNAEFRMEVTLKPDV